MNYRNEIIAKLTQLENYARTCFVIQLGLSNGQGKMVNEFIDRFMSDLTSGEILNDAGNQILLDECLYNLLPNCRNSVNPKDCLLFNLVRDWINDNLYKCYVCDTWYMQPDDYAYTGLCPDCQERENENNPATVADFQNELNKEGV